MKTHVMIDIETLGLEPGSVILSLGAVCFWDKEIRDEFYQRIDIQSCIVSGLKMDVPTLLWWMRQSDAARAEFQKPCISLYKAMVAFDEWIPDNEAQIWGNGAAFDNVLLACACKAVGVPAQWAHKQSLCYRTVKNLYPQIPIKRIGEHHNALDDARSQAIHLMEMLPNL